MLINSLLANVKLKQQLVDVPELGEDAQVIVREMGGKRGAEYYDAIKDEKDGKLIMIHMVIACVVDEEGNKMHTHDQVDMLHDALPLAVINRLAQAANEVNGFSAQSDAKKNK